MLRFIICCVLCGAAAVWVVSQYPASHPSSHASSHPSHTRQIIRKEPNLYALEGNYSGWSVEKARRAHEEFQKQQAIEQDNQPTTDPPSPSPAASPSDLYIGLDQYGRVAVGTPGPDGRIRPGALEQLQTACIAKQLGVSYETAELLAAQAQAYYEYEHFGASALAPDVTGLSPQMYMRLTAAAMACM